jgi:hypothetical protein
MVIVSLNVTVYNKDGVRRSIFDDLAALPKMTVFGRMFSNQKNHIRLPALVLAVPKASLSGYKLVFHMAVDWKLSVTGVLF